MTSLLKPLAIAVSLITMTSPVWADCAEFEEGISLCDVPETWFESPNAGPESKATFMIEGKTFAIMSYRAGAQTPTDAIQLALNAVADKFNISADQIEQTNSGASDIDGISAVFVDYKVPFAGNVLFYRTTIAWSPNLTLHLTTYGFENDLAENFDALHMQFVSSTKLAK